MQKTETNAQAEIERCVLCGKETEFKTDALIKDRIGYVEGIGQLCRDCHAELFAESWDCYGDVVL